MKNSMNRKYIKKGFTLVELIITLAIGIVILGVIYQIFTTQTKMYKISVNEDKIQTNGANCIAYIRESIVNSLSVKPPSATSKVPPSILSGCTDIVEITLKSGDVIVYTISSDNKLYKYKEGSTDISPGIAADVNSITVGISSPHTIDVKINKGDSTEDFNTIVASAYN